MRKIDINCDMGEGVENDAALMPFISSANIACGFHAGDSVTMHRTIDLAVKHGVAIGAHVSFPDQENFGRTEMDLPPAKVYEMVQEQISTLVEITQTFSQRLHHVKPHGALYNMSARSEQLATTIATAVYDFDPSLVLFGLSGSYSISAAARIGLKTASEVFADRAYEDNGSLRSRSLPGALLDDEDAVAKQVLQMVNSGSVISINGMSVLLSAQTICIHGDGPHALAFAKTIFEHLKNHSIEIASF